MALALEEKRIMVAFNKINGKWFRNKKKKVTINDGHDEATQENGNFW